LYEGTGSQHWRKTFEAFLSEKKGLRWQRLHPGSHVALNGHPIYANQGAFRLNSMYRFQTDSQRKAVLHDLLKYVAELQMKRDFPGPMYRRFHSEEAWQRLREKWKWGDGQLHGAVDAWNRFEPAMLDDSPLAVLAHVRFPLGGFHMVLMSEHPEMIRPHLARIWRMLNAVDLKKVSAAETNYLFAVAGLYVYAFYFQQQK
jgi:hypothetical protein